MKKLILLLFFPLTMVAQDQNVAGHTPYIEVTGSAEKEITPDIIYIRIVLQETNDKNKVLIGEQENSLKTKLKENGFDLNALVIKNTNASFLRLTRKTSDVINRKEYSLKVSNSIETYKVFKILDEINVKDASIAETSHTNIQLYRKEVKRLALQAAKEKATDLLNAIGETIDKPLIITELNESDFSQPSQMRSNIAISRDYADNDDDYLELKPIKLKYMMFARFKIK